MGRKQAHNCPLKSILHSHFFPKKREIYFELAQLQHNFLQIPFPAIIGLPLLERFKCLQQFPVYREQLIMP